jgi:hypothetical protein
MQVAYYELLAFLFWETFGADWELFYSKSCKVRGNVVPSDAALALPIPPKVRSHDAAHTPASFALFLKNTASPSKYIPLHTLM